MVHKIYFIKSPVRVLNDEVQRRSYTILTTHNLVSTLSNFCLATILGQATAPSSVNHYVYIDYNGSISIELAALDLCSF